MDAGFCNKCNFKTPTQRKFGVTYSCDKEVTHMDVSFHARDRHANKRNSLCPLLLNKKDEVEK